MDSVTINKLYSKYAPVYDYFFGWVLTHGRQKTVKLMNPQPREQILEVGVGTGISLSMYPRSSNVVGIDICGDMLKKASKKKMDMGLTNVSLYTMDAEKMRFADSRFDKVVASYVISVVPDPVKALMEMKRVCKRGGEIFILNHFAEGDEPASGVAKAFYSVKKKLGMGRLLDPEKILGSVNLKILDIQKVNPLKLFHIVRCKNE